MKISHYTCICNTHETHEEALFLQKIVYAMKMLLDVCCYDLLCPLQALHSQCTDSAELAGLIS